MIRLLVIIHKDTTRGQKNTIKNITYFILLNLRQYFY